MPLANLHSVPESLEDRQAVFCEPLAAAFSLLSSLGLQGGESILGIGDGRLGLLAAQVLRQQKVQLYWAGRHESKLALLRQWGIAAGQAEQLEGRDELWDIVVDTSGTPDGLQLALKMVRPGGTVAVKTTTHRERALDLNDLVVRELKLVGSRCGPFQPALEALRSGQVQVEPLISAVYPLEEGLQALERAAQPGTLKVLLRH
jgi:threonine dehydrogenase-like Zn-dependent dehydrogenase